MTVSYELKVFQAIPGTDEENRVVFNHRFPRIMKSHHLPVLRKNKEHIEKLSNLYRVEIWKVVHREVEITDNLPLAGHTMEEKIINFFKTHPGPQKKSHVRDAILDDDKPPHYFNSVFTNMVWSEEWRTRGSLLRVSRGIYILKEEEE